MKRCRNISSRHSSQYQHKIIKELINQDVEKNDSTNKNERNRDEKLFFMSIFKILI